MAFDPDERDLDDDDLPADDDIEPDWDDEPDDSSREQIGEGIRRAMSPGRADPAPRPTATPGYPPAVKDLCADDARGGPFAAAQELLPTTSAHTPTTNEPSSARLCCQWRCQFRKTVTIVRGPMLSTPARYPKTSVQ